MVDGVERAAACSMLEALVDEMVNKEGAVGSLNIMILEIINQGQEIRDQVERRLRMSRLKEEQILRLVVANVARDERLEDMARKRAALRKRFCRIETDKMTDKMSLLLVADWRPWR